MDIPKIPTPERRALYYRAIHRKGASIDWTTGTVTWPQRTT